MNGYTFYPARDAMADELHWIGDDCPDILAGARLRQFRIELSRGYVPTALAVAYHAAIANPGQFCPVARPIAAANPTGWADVDGIALPAVDTWADR